MNNTIVNSLEELDSLAANFAKQLKADDVICMTGDLGAGKTTFVSAVAKNLGIEEGVQSPTFNLLLQYQNAEGILLNHFDLYRLENEEDLEDIGFFEIIEGEGISFIEWSEKFPGVMPDNAINLTIEKFDDGSRKFSW